MVIRCALVFLMGMIAACSLSEEPITEWACTDPVMGCTSQVTGKTVSLKFSEIPKPLHPFDLEVSVEAESVEGSFQMQGMEMGLNRYRLQPKAGMWQAQIILPICMQGRGDWVLQLEVTTASGIRRYRLPFKSA